MIVSKCLRLFSSPEPVVSFGHVAEFMWWMYIKALLINHSYFFLGILRDQGRSFLEFALRSWPPWGQVSCEPAAR